MDGIERRLTSKSRIGYGSEPESKGIQIGFVLPLNSENRWSDMLAVLFASDPGPMCKVLELDVDASEVMVHRELTIDPASRPDFVLKLGDKPLAVLEAKVLAGLGVRQLERYYDAEPSAAIYALVYPEAFEVNLDNRSPWKGISWEAILHAYAKSENPWVAGTARAWQDHLAASLPRLGGDTVWDDLLEGEDFVIAMRARICWLSRQLTDATISHEVSGSSAGVSWILSLYAETSVPGYWIKVEIEESLPVRNYPARHRSANRYKARGPSAKVMLWQGNVCTSANFDWDYLRTLWPTMDEFRQDWVRNSPNRKAEHEKAGLARIRAAGVPRWVGVGFGEAQARIKRSCMFGARIQFPRDVTLAQMSTEITHLGQLAKTLADVPYSPAD